MAEAIEIIEGRGGLKLPRFDWNAEDIRAMSFLTFFKQMFEVNGFDCTTEDPYAFSPGAQRSFVHELAVPPYANKPAAIIKGSYAPRPKDEIEEDMRRARQHEEWGQRRASTIGHETYGICVLPARAGPLETFVEVTYTHQRGSTNFDDDEPVTLTWPTGDFNRVPYNRELHGDDLGAHQNEQEDKYRSWLRTNGKQVLEFLE